MIKTSAEDGCDCNDRKPCLKVVVHYIPSVPVEGHVIKNNKLVAMTAVRNGFPDKKQSGKKDVVAGRSRH